MLRHMSEFTTQPINGASVRSNAVNEYSGAPVASSVDYTTQSVVTLAKKHEQSGF